MDTKIKVFNDADAVAEWAADAFVAIAESSISERGRFCVALSGGSTPKKLYQKLATPQYLKKLKTDKIFLFFGDERNVPINDERSNYKMVREAFIEPANFPAQNVFRWITESPTPDEAAALYQDTLTNFFNNDLPRFDLVFLGLGTDCHTASLFPHSPALNETKKPAAANFIEKYDEYRLTLTFPVINNARNVIFIATGKGKADAVFEVMNGEVDHISKPAQAVAPANGSLKWLLDQAAAQRIADDHAKAGF